MKREFIIYVVVFLLGAILSGIAVFFTFGGSGVKTISQNQKEGTGTQLQEQKDTNYNSITTNVVSTGAVIQTGTGVEISTPVNIDEPFCKIQKEVSNMTEQEYSQFLLSLGKLNKKYLPKNLLAILKKYEDCDILQEQGYLTDENIGDCYIDIAIRELATDKKLSSQRAKKLLEENVPTFKDLEAAFIENKCDFVMKVNRDIFPLCKGTKAPSEYYKEGLEQARKLICE